MTTKKPKAHAAESTRRRQLQQQLTVEDHAEFFVILRAVSDIANVLEFPESAQEMIMALIENLVAGALDRSKPNRRLPYLSQWRHFLCCLPDTLTRSPKEARWKIAVETIKGFRLEDQRGKNKAAQQFPEGANCLLEKDGDIWYAQVPEADLHYEGDVSGPKRMSTEAERGIVESCIRTEHAKYLRPVNVPGAFKRHYDKIIVLLPNKKRDENFDRDQLVSLCPDIPVAIMTRWINNKVSRREMALLIAALRTGQSHSENYLTHLSEKLRLQNAIERWREHRQTNKF